MKPGEKTVCPECGQEIFVQEKTLMDDWKPVGKVLVCPLCGAHLSRQGHHSIDLDEEKEKKPDTSALSALLGEDDSEEIGPLELDGNEGHFCRDCRYYIVHPFMNRCTLHECEVNPMGDCDDFIHRSKKNEDDEEEGLE